jgi:SAM-dependent methyltransferase
MPKVVRPGVQEGYDLWAETYDVTPNPLVSLDRRHTLNLLRPARNELILDAACGTGQHLKAMARGGTKLVGIDVSFAMLRAAQRNVPRATLAQADLDRELPFFRCVFDAVLCALVGEHLTNLSVFFRETFGILKPFGRLVFSVFHPELAAAGIESNFRLDGVEYRLGAQRHSVGHYIDVVADSGFNSINKREFHGDRELVNEIPWAVKYLGRPLLLVIEARRSG